MNKLFHFTVAALLIASMLGLVSCNGIPGAESGDLAPERPSNTISGFVVDDAISGAFINVYAFDGGERGGLLASTTSAADGSYSVELDNVVSRPVLLEARGGSYVELATGQQIDIKEDEVLKAVVILQPGQALSIMVTPLTHLAAALVEYRLVSGVAVEQAIISAAAEMNDLFGFDVVSVYPRSIAEQGQDDALTAEHLYGFFLSALSSWTKRVSEQNDLAPHAIYNSIALSQVLYKEVASDGLLDGKALSSGTDNVTDLALGVVALAPNAYRISLAQHMLAMASSSANVSGVTVEQLLPLAYRFLNSQHRLFAGVETQLIGDQVSVTAGENLGGYHSGVFDYVIELGSPELISSVSYSVDNFELPILVVPGDRSVPIDTRQFEDGKHTVTMVAKDWLGNSVATHSSVFEFDNTSPFINVTSELYTKDQSYVLSGNVEYNGSRISQFEIQGRPVSINDDNTWSIKLQLEAGDNHVSLVLKDEVGNEFPEDIIITPDQTPPVIDTSAGHSLAIFSGSDSTVFSGNLADKNEENSLQINTDKIDLDGISISRASLENESIPYFVFQVNDPIVEGVSTERDALDVQVRYEKNGDASSDWRKLIPIDDEYLVPLASETLHSSWDQASPIDVHAVRVHVQDKAGNVGEKLFTFKTDFIVSELIIDQLDDFGHDLFASTPFTQRGSLHGREFDAVGYTFTNTTGKAIYVQPEDAGGHDAVHEFVKLVRENKVRLKTSIDWLMRIPENVMNICEADPEKDWDLILNPAQVFNYSGGQWVAVSPPEPVFGELEYVDSDTPIPPEPGDVTAVEDFDSEFASFPPITLSQGIVTFYFDYLISFGQLLPEPALVLNWELNKDNVLQRSCDLVRSFSQQEIYSYVSEPGYPKDSRLVLGLGDDDKVEITVSGYTAFDNTSSADIDEISGWYRIPPGHNVTIIKRVRTPDLPLYDDTEVANAGTVAKYNEPKLYDKTITWTVNRELTVKAVHDAGVDNIFSMTPTEIITGEGAVPYPPMSR